MREDPPAPLDIRSENLGRLSYAEALACQRTRHQSVIDARGGTDGPMWILQLEHQPPVVTVTRRPGVAEHLLVDEERLNALGIELAETDRGGDITYHGPGQLVLYPILDLNRLGLRIHPYLRLLEEAVIRTLAVYGIRGERDPEATGVWVPAEHSGELDRKICAMGVRLSRWCSMHGLALNVEPNLEHFQLIVPCGLSRPVTSLEQELGAKAPTLAVVREELTRQLIELLHAQAEESEERKSR